MTTQYMPDARLLLRLILLVHASLKRSSFQDGQMARSEPFELIIKTCYGLLIMLTRMEFLVSILLTTRSSWLPEAMMEKSEFGKSEHEI